MVTRDIVGWGRGVSCAWRQSTCVNRHVSEGGEVEGEIGEGEGRGARGGPLVGDFRRKRLAALPRGLQEKG